ncbi:MAG: EF-hand domain-containing protein [Planctomycetes bacterium]|nr:EF-hand domain-containing protein [Planctomycetota bacterium]
MRRVLLVLAVAFAGVVVCIGAAPQTGAPGGTPSVKQIFTRLDADGDGSLTEAEYVGRSRFDGETARRIFRASDADGDGKVTEAEYIDNRLVTDKAKEVFAWIDADGDGAMTRHEIAARIDRVFKEMDADGDGRVTTPEFMSARWRWQVRIDWKKRDGPGPGDKAAEAKPE